MKLAEFVEEVRSVPWGWVCVVSLLAFFVWEHNRNQRRNLARSTGGRSEWTETRLGAACQRGDDLACEILEYRLDRQAEAAGARRGQ